MRVWRAQLNAGEIVCFTPHPPNRLALDPNYGSATEVFMVFPVPPGKHWDNLSIRP
jgi:hypothetical protein